MAAAAGAVTASVAAQTQTQGGAEEEKENETEKPAGTQPIKIQSPESVDIFEPHSYTTPTLVTGEHEDEHGDEFRALISPRPSHTPLAGSSSPRHAQRAHHRRYTHHRRRQHNNSEPTNSRATAVGELISSDAERQEIENEDDEDGYTTSQSQKSDNTLLHHRSKLSAAYPNLGPIHRRSESRTLSGTKLSTTSFGSGWGNLNGGNATRQEAKSNSPSASAAPGGGFYYLPTSIRAEGYAPTAVELADLPPLGSPMRVQLISTSSSSSATAKAAREHSGEGAAESETLLARADDKILNDLPQTIPHSTSFTELLNKKRRLSKAEQQRLTYYQLIPTAEKDEPQFLRTPSPGTPKSPTARLRRHASLDAVAEQKQNVVHEMLKQQMPMQRKMPAKCRAYHRLLKQHSGHYNMVVCNIPHRRARLIYDIWNTLVDLKWRDIILLFLLSYFVTWLFFGLLYYLVAIIHGDLDAKNIENTEWNPCVLNLNSFTTAYLFSFESQHTIGYGFRHITDQCSEAIIILCFQSALGAGLQAFMVGLVFTRIQRPTRRAQTLLFSKNVCVCTRDGQLCLLFRIGNMRKSLIIHSRVTAHLVHHRKTLEGELLPLHQHELYVQLDSMSSSAIAHHHLAWPMTACHIINAESPLYDMDRESLGEARFELIVTLEGVIESTGQALEARMSYLPSEILWGYRFAPLISYRLRTDNYGLGPKGRARVAGQYVVDFEHFNALEAAKQTPTCSAAEFEMAKRAKLSSVSQTPVIFRSKNSSVNELSDRSTSDSGESGEEGDFAAEEVAKLNPVHSNSDLKQYYLESSLQKDEAGEVAASPIPSRSSTQTLRSPRRSLADEGGENRRVVTKFNLGAMEDDVEDVDTEHHNRKDAVRRKKSSVKSPDRQHLKPAEQFTFSGATPPPGLPRPFSQRTGRHQPKNTSAGKLSLPMTLSAPQSLETSNTTTQSKVKLEATTSSPTGIPNSLRPLLNLLQHEMNLTALAPTATAPAITSRSSSSIMMVTVANNVKELPTDATKLLPIVQELPKRKVSSAIQRPVLTNLLSNAAESGNFTAEAGEQDEQLLAEKAMARRRRLGSLLDNPQYTFDLKPDPAAVRRLKSSASHTSRTPLLPSTSEDVERNMQVKTRKSSFSFHRRTSTANDDQYYSSRLLARSKIVEAQPIQEHTMTTFVTPANDSSSTKTDRTRGSVGSQHKRASNMSRRRISVDVVSNK